MLLLIKVVFVFVFVVFYLINFREGVTSHQGYYCFSNFVVIVVGRNGAPIPVQQNLSLLKSLGSPQWHFTTCTPRCFRNHRRYHLF